MQLGIRLHDVAGATLEEKLANAKAQGFACGHVALSKVISQYSVADSALTPGLAMYIKKQFSKYDLDIAVLGNYLNLANPDPQKLAAIQKRYMTHIRFAALLGCGVVGTETGAPNEEYRYEPACRSEEALDTFITNLKPVVRYAENMGVIIAIEPVIRHIVYNPKRARQVLDAIASPNLQIILDPVNLLDESNAADHRRIIQEAIELLGEDVAVVHLKDFKVQDGKLLSIGAGMGEMDYTGLMRFIKKEKPYIHATLEDTKPDNAVAARLFVQKQWEQA